MEGGVGSSPCWSVLRTRCRYQSSDQSATIYTRDNSTFLIGLKVPNCFALMSKIRMKTIKNSYRYRKKPNITVSLWNCQRIQAVRISARETEVNASLTSTSTTAHEQPRFCATISPFDEKSQFYSVKCVKVCFWLALGGSQAL